MSPGTACTRAWRGRRWSGHQEIIATLVGSEEMALFGRDERPCIAGGRGRHRPVALGRAIGAGIIGRTAVKGGPIAGRDAVEERPPARGLTACIPLILEDASRA
jgi:hypothetical protein